MEPPNFPKLSSQQIDLNPSPEALSLTATGVQAQAAAKEAEEGEARALVISEGGDPGDATLVLSHSTLQFGKYQGQTFKWLLENDVGYAILVVRRHLTERETDLPMNSLTDNKDAFAGYSCAYPDFRELVHDARKKVQVCSSQPGQKSRALVGPKQCRAVPKDKFKIEETNGDCEYKHLAQSAPKKSRTSTEDELNCVVAKADHGREKDGDGKSQRPSQTPKDSDSTDDELSLAAEADRDGAKNGRDECQWPVWTSTEDKLAAEVDHEGMDSLEEDALDAELYQEEEDLLLTAGLSPTGRLRGAAQKRKRKFCPVWSRPLSYFDIDIQAPVPLPFNPKRPVGIDLGRLRQGLQSVSQKMTREIDFFLLFFTQAVVAELCAFTNIQGWRLVVNCPSYGNAQGAWTEVTTEEFYRFLGLAIYMGYNHLPGVHKYWGTASLQGSWARAFMSRNRYNAVLAALHVVDPDTEDNRDRLQKLRYLMDHLKQTCKQLYQPNQNVSIDERMVKSKAQVSFKQYTKAKPTRWGFKLWVIASSDTGYTLDFNIYTGSRDGRTTDLARKVVEELAEPFTNQGYNLWFDNFYTSPALMVQLRELGINACGTCRTHHKQIPGEFKDFKTWELQSTRGDMRWRRIEGNILTLQWRDTRTVTCLSNFHNANDSIEVTRLVEQDGVWGRKLIRQPAAINDYNKNMGGVYGSDQMINSYNVLQRTQKWWKTLLFHFIDIAVLNSFLLFRDWKSNCDTPDSDSKSAPYSQITFRENLSRQLADISVGAKFPDFSAKAKTHSDFSSFHTQHVPELQHSSKNCWLCYRKNKVEKKTRFFCVAPECKERSFCLVRNRNCFKAWHSSTTDSFRK